MAWNQPGGQNNSPWGRRPGQGGPDLDERVKSWQRRLDQLLRPGGEGGKLALVVVAIVVALWLGSGIFQIKAAERGVILRFGKFVAVEPPGLGVRWPWPIESLYKVNVASINSSDFKSRVLTSDINLVDVRFSVQYQFTDPRKVLFKLREPETTLSEVSESAIREIVGRSTLDDVIVGVTRPQITTRTKDLIQKTLDEYNSGITVTTVNLTDVQVPDSVIPAQRDTNKAIADKENSINAAQAYANSILPAAQGAAAQMQQNAQAYKARVTALADGQTARFLQLEEAYSKAPEVTRRRLYMDTIEGVLSRSHKVLIDSKAPGSGGGNMFYLPLDKLLDKAASGSSDQSTESTTTTLPKEQDSVTVEARGRGER
ncbi:MAG TPA: FtsH protease activity modulator HflK [Steroidobacteraceae bacterium]|nr:FtsH protease activity modulator HflK [Steroidobacteraceae bacterium]